MALFLQQQCLQQQFCQQQGQNIRSKSQRMGKPGSIVGAFFVRSRAFLVLLLFGLCLQGLASQALASDLSAAVDRTAIGPDETLNLTLRYEGQAMGDPDFSDLERDFEIVANQRQSQFSFGGGAGQSYTLWQLALMPRRAGTLVVPSFNFKGEVSDAIPVEVSDTPKSAASDKAVFVETELESDQAFVQEQVLLTLRLYTSVPLNSLSAPELEVPGARVVRVHEAQFQKTINGTEYTVIELKYALFADNPGELAIPALRFSGTVPDARDPFSSFGGGFFGRSGKRMVVDSSIKSLRVKPRPEGIAASAWLPSKGLSLAQRWSATPDELVVGEPVTRSVIISAQGLQGSQLPELNMEAGDGFKLYPDQPKVEDSVSASGILGSRIESVAVVPTRPGQLTLPAISVKWWDTVSGKLRETRLESQTVTVVAAKNLATGRPPEEQPSPSQLADTQTASEQTVVAPTRWWLLLVSNALFALLTVMFALLWWRRRAKGPNSATDSRGNSDNDTERAAFERIRLNPPEKLAELRDGILHWARIFWHKPQLKTLADVVTVSGRSDLTPHFAALDKHLYGAGASTDDVDGRAILEILAALRQGKRKHGETHPGNLPPLYPGQ